MTQIMTRSGRIGTVVAISLIGLAGLALLFMAKRFITRTERVGAGASAPHEMRTAADWYARGNELLKSSKDLRAAAEAYRKAVELAPSMGEAHYGLGYVLLQMNDVDGSLAEIESALSLAPEGASWREDADNALILANLRKGEQEKP
jgi:tetratricopeptide (TPR) repeat protein